MAEQEAESGVKFRIIENGGGRSLKSQLQKSNPTQSRGCDKINCIACQTGRGEGGNCHMSGVNYEVECQLCPDGARRSILVSHLEIYMLEVLNTVTITRIEATNHS